MADVVIAVARAAANTATGTQDITTTDLGGKTPKAALLIATRAVTDAAAADGAGWYVGATDGANHWTTTFESEHGLDVTDTQTAAAAGTLLNIYNGAADAVVDGAAEFSAWITNGIRINWTDAPSAGWLLTVVLFAGDDLSVAAGTTDLGNTVDLATDITAVGFEADVLICASQISNNVAFSMGFIHNDRAGGVTQRCEYFGEATGQGTSLVVSHANDGCCMLRRGTTGLAIFEVVASGFDASGFTVTTTTAGASSNDLYWLALRLGTTPVASKVYTRTTPTSTGNSDDAGAGFTPQAVFYLTGLCEAIDTSYTNANAGAFGFAAITSGAQYANSVNSEDAAGTSNTQSLSDDKALNVPLHDGATGVEGAFDSFLATGVRINYTAVTATGKVWPALAIEASGGTEYNQAVGGATTPAGELAKQDRTAKDGAIEPSGVLIRQSQTAEAGAISMAGEIVRQTARQVAGAVSTAGSLTRQIGTLLAGALGPAGTVETIRTRLMSIAGEIIPAGEISKQSERVVSGILNSSGELGRWIWKVLAGALAGAGALLGELLGAAVEHDVTISDAALFGAALADASPHGLSVGDMLVGTAVIADSNNP